VKKCWFKILQQNVAVSWVFFASRDVMMTRVQTALSQPSCPASMMNFIWFTDDKLLKFYHCSHKKHRKRSLSHTSGDSLTFAPSSKTVVWCQKSVVLKSKNITISQAVCAGALSCWKVQKSSYPQKCVKVIVLGVFCSCNDILAGK